MRIGYLADGRNVHTYKWMRFFKERGHDVHLLSFAPLENHHVAAVKETGGTYHGEMGLFHLKRFWRTANDYLKLMRFLRRERIEILHCHFLGVNAWYAALSRFHPFVITVMGGDICGPDWCPRDDIRDRWLMPLALRKADLITCWSQQLIDVVQRYCPPTTQVEVIHGGVDLRRFFPGPKPQYLRERWNIPPHAKVVLSPRLMMTLYNLDTIASAADEVCQTLPETYFLFAVLPDAKHEDYEARVHAIAASGAAADRVRFVGGIPHDEMADYYRLADVTVSIPSTDGTPMSVLESMACGTPVVVGDIPDYDSHYIEPGKTVLTANTRDPQSTASAVLRLLREPELTARLASEAKERVHKTGSYESQMSRMEHLYLQLL